MRLKHYIPISKFKYLIFLDITEFYNKIYTLTKNAQFIKHGYFLSINVQNLAIQSTITLQNSYTLTSNF